MMENLLLTQVDHEVSKLFTDIAKKVKNLLFKIDKMFLKKKKKFLLNIIFFSFYFYWIYNFKYFLIGSSIYFI